MLKKSQPFSDAARYQPNAQINPWQINPRQSQINNKVIQRIISSNQELIHEQMMKIRQLQKENQQLELKFKAVSIKYEALTELISLQSRNQSNSSLKHQNQAEYRQPTAEKEIKIDVNQLIQKIVQLQQKLSAAKVELAIKSTECETARFHLHHENSSKKSRKTSISEDSIENIGRLFQSRTTQNSNQSQNKLEGQNKILIDKWNAIYDRYGTIEQKMPRFKQKSAYLMKKFIPKQLRSKIWPVCIQNTLGMTPSLYSQLSQRRQKGWVNEKVRAQIDKDIKRSFSVKTHRQISSATVIQVVQFLEIFHIFRPDIGYVQGMTYPVLVLIPILGKAKAFDLLCNLLLGNPFFRKLFSMQGNFLSKICRAFQLILQESIPYLWRRFKEMSIHSEIYLIEWLFSLFSRGMTIESTLKFWDHLIFFEEVAIFRMALAIFEQLGPIILELNYEETLNFLRQYAVNIQEKKLLQALASSKLTKEKIKKMFNKIKI